MKLIPLSLFILLFSCKERHNPVYITKHGDTILVKNHDPLDIRVTIPGYRAVISVAPIVDTIPGIWFITTIAPLPPKDTIGSDVIEERIKKDHGDNWQLSVDSSDAWLVDSSRIKAIAWFQKITNPVKKRKAKRLKGKYWRGQIRNTPYKAY